MAENLTIKNGCPDCGGSKYYRGPEGAMSINICCANPECRSAFNDMGPFGLERISNTAFRSAFPNQAESDHYLKESARG